VRTGFDNAAEEIGSTASDREMIPDDVVTGMGPWFVVRPCSAPQIFKRTKAAVGVHNNIRVVNRHRTVMSMLYDRRSEQLEVQLLVMFLPDIGKTANPTPWISPRSSRRSLSCHGISPMYSDSIDKFSPINAARSLQNASVLFPWQEVNLNTTDPSLF